MTFVAGQVPPGATPFKPGQSGNPEGRPVGARSRATVLRRLLEVAAKYQVANGEVQEGTIEDQIAAAQIDKALKGDTFAFKEIMDSVYGKQGTALDITSKGEKLPSSFDVRLLPAGPPLASNEKEIAEGDV